MGSARLLNKIHPKQMLFYIDYSDEYRVYIKSVKSFI